VSAFPYRVADEATFLERLDRMRAATHGGHLDTREIAAILREVEPLPWRVGQWYRIRIRAGRPAWRHVHGLDEAAPELAAAPALFEPANPPGPIERRYVTPQPLNGRHRPSSPAYDDAARIARSRANGARRHVEVTAARRAQRIQEESPMPDSTVIEPSPLARLSDAARAAHDALEEKTVADQAWEVAREALEAAWDALEGILGPEPEPPDHLPAQAIPLSNGSVMRAHSDGAPATIGALREIGEAIIANPPKAKPRQAGHHAASPSEAREKAERAERVMAAIERNGGDKRMAAAELGMKLNAVVMVAKHAGPRS
jgi:hypothetical protein